MRILRLIRVARAWRSFAEAFRLMRCPGVPLRLKLVTAALALLILSPLNILGDFPLVGLLDDAALLALLAGWFVGRAGRYEVLVAAPRQAPGDVG